MGISLEDAYGPAPTQAPAAAPVPTGISLDDAYGPSTAPPSSLLQDMAQNITTGAAHIPGAILGTPQALSHMVDAVGAWGLNKFDGGSRTAADLDKYNLTARFFPSPEDINSGVEKGADTVNRAAGGSGYQDYKPMTGAGQLGQAFVTAAGAGALDPIADISATKQGWNILKQGLAGSAGQGASMIDPSNPVLAPLAALLTHTSLSLGGKAGAAITENVARPFYAPTAAGIDAAGRKLSAVDNSLPAPPNPSSADQGYVSNALGQQTADVGPGSSPETAMETIQGGLSTREQALKDARSAAVSPLAQAFRQEPPVPLTDMPASVMGRPAVTPALNSAMTDMRNGAQAANNPYGAPTIDGALTPDLLGRTATKLGAQASDARMSSADTGQSAGLTAASMALKDYLSTKFPSTFPQYTSKYEEMSRPLDVFKQPTVARAMAPVKNEQGTFLGYNQQPNSLLNTLAETKNPGTVVQHFIDAAGGDKASIVGPLQDAIVGRLRDKGVIDPTTGEIDAKALTQETKRYLPTLGMYMPELQKKFGNATALQGTLDTMRTQAKLADDISSGALRDDAGAITGQSMDKWMRANRDDLTTTQGQPAMMRLGQIRDALKDAPGGAAQAVAEEVLPGLVSDRIGGSENAILSMMAGHQAAGIIAKPQLVKFRKAYSDTVEQIIQDPVKGQQIVDAAKQRPGEMSGAAIRRAIADMAVRGMRASATASALPTPSP